MRRGFGCLGSLLVIVLILAVVFVVEYGGDYLLYAPWAYGWFGRPTLTGNWEGTVRTHNGPYAVYLQLTRDRNSRGTPLNSFGEAALDGHVSWCGPGIRNATSTIYGRANRAASNVVLEIHDFSHLPPGLFPLRLQGAWHGSTLALHVTFALSLHNAYSSSNPDAVRPLGLTFRKQGHSAYQATCTRI